jgi:hypothetical protein
VSKVKVPVIGTVNKVVSIEADAPSRAEVNASIQAAIANLAAVGGAAPQSAYPTLWRLIREIPPNIQGLAAMSGTGIMVRTGVGTFANRSIATTAHLSVTNGSGVAGDPTLDLVFPILAADGSAAAPSYSFSGASGTGVYVETGDVNLRFSVAGTQVFTATAVALVPLKPLLGLDGSASNPFYSFSDDPDCGVYRVGANVVGIATGGTLRAQFTSNGLEMPSGQQIYLADGAAAAPGIVFGNDTDTGIFRSTTNQMGFATGGVLRFSATSDGFLLPSGQQLLLPDAAAAAPALIFAADPDTGIYRDSGNSLAIAVGGGNTGAVFRSTLCAIYAPIWARDGSAGAPAYTFENDTDTGIYRRTANEVTIAAGGVPRFYVNTGFVQSDPAFYAARFNTLGAGTGSAATPDVTWEFDANLGLYRVEADHLGVAASALTFTGAHGASAGNIRSGTYTPTLTAVSGVSGLSAVQCQYLRVGNVVTVSGELSGTDAVGTNTVGISLPIASNLTAAGNLGGAGATGQGLAANISGDTANDRASITWSNNSTGSFTVRFTFTYLVQ